MLSYLISLIHWYLDTTGSSDTIYQLIGLLGLSLSDQTYKVKTKTLALHYLYNLQIKLKDREKLSIGTIYLFSTTEQEAFKDFISENLNTRFICPILSSYRIFILFVKKKYSPLHLCINFQELSYIIWYMKG